MEKNCQNCDFEYYCDHLKADVCEDWRADMECREERRKNEETD